MAIIVFVRVGAEPSTLTENVFRFLSVEGGAMALIKSVKTVTKKDTCLLYTSGMVQMHRNIEHRGTGGQTISAGI